VQPRARFTVNNVDLEVVAPVGPYRLTNTLYPARPARSRSVLSYLLVFFPVNWKSTPPKHACQVDSRWTRFWNVPHNAAGLDPGTLGYIKRVTLDSKMALPV
jgi:hypothetical protein